MNIRSCTMFCNKVCDSQTLWKTTRLGIECHTPFFWVTFCHCFDMGQRWFWYCPFLSCLWVWLRNKCKPCWIATYPNKGYGWSCFKVLFLCKGKNTIVGASSPWPTTWRKPLVSQCTRRLPYGAGTLPQEGAQTALCGSPWTWTWGVIEKVPPSIYKVERTKTKVQII